MYEHIHIQLPRESKCSFAGIQTTLLIKVSIENLAIFVIAPTNENWGSLSYSYN